MNDPFTSGHGAAGGAREASDASSSPGGPCPRRGLASDLVRVLAAAALVRALALASYCMVGTDSMHYLRMAASIRGGAADEAWAHPLRHHPGYSTLAAAVHAVGRGTLDLEGAALAVSFLSGILLVAPVFLLAREAYGRRAGLLAGLFAAFHPELVRLSADVMTEPVFFLLQGTAAVALVHGLRRRAWSGWAAAGAAAAGALWVRAEGIYMAAAITGAGAFMVARGLRKDRRAAGGWALRAGLALTVLLAVYFPYVRWVHAKTGRWFFTHKGSVANISKTLAASPDAWQHPRPLSLSGSANAFGRSASWAILPWMALGLAAAARRGPWNAPAATALGLAAIGSAAPLGAHLLVHYAVSPRYYLQGTFFLLPAAGYGLAAAAEWAAGRRPAGPRLGDIVLAAGTASALILAVAMARDPARCGRIGLREAGEWVRAEHGGPGAWMMGTHEQSAYYADTDLVACPRDYDGVERELTAAPGRWLVVLESDFEEMAPDFRRRLDQRQRIYLARVFPSDGGAGYDHAWVLRAALTLGPE